ncbi:MAG: ABC transporter ATP-binding protein [Gammaproteobacteria bacterium]
MYFADIEVNLQSSFKNPHTRAAAPAIELSNVSKTFRPAESERGSLREWFINAAYGRDPIDTNNQIRLNNVSFRVEKGESVALIGDNGSGKSTLLRIVAGIYQPNQGQVTVNGRVSPVLELGAGLHPLLTGMQNICLNAAIHGLAPARVSELMPEILEFSELGKDIEMPVKHYSSGMKARLAFSIATSVETDILLLDEVLSVGDKSFQKKCETRIRKIQKSGVTILYVTHTLEDISKICSRAIWLADGKIVADGDATAIVNKYWGD